MSGLCGWVGSVPAAASPESAIAAMTPVLYRFDGAPLSRELGPGHALAVAAPAPRASLVTAHGVSAAFWGMPDFRDEQFAHIATERGPAAALIEAFRSHGPECCARIGGAFAFALIDDVRGEALLAVDRMGIHALTWRQQGSTLLFASTADAIHAFPGVEVEADWQSILDYVHFHMVPAPVSAFRGEHRLLPGQYLHYRDQRVRLGSYWSPHFVEDEKRPFAELREEFLSLLSDSVRRMSRDVPTGAFLSGGTDSSTVSGMLGQATGRPAETFSIGFDQQGYDEIEYARIAARHFRTSQHEYYVTAADIAAAIPKLAEIYDQPFGNSSAVPTYCCARYARESGVQLRLGGDGGDELFGGNDRYATQYLYSLYEFLPRPIRAGLLEPVARNLHGATVLPPVRWYRRLVDLASTPMPDRLDAHNLLARIGPSQVFTPDLLSAIDLHHPLKLMRDVYNANGAQSLVNRMLAYDFKFTLADNDLPKVMRSCEAAGLLVDFPMLDDRLVEFSTRLSPDMKLKGTKLRYFFKEALRGFLPDEIIAKTKHGFGLPFGQWLRTHKPLEDIVMGALESLRGRGIVRAQFIDGLLGRHLVEHPGYYGTMAWVLTMLELWFQNHCRSFQAIDGRRAAAA